MFCTTNEDMGDKMGRSKPTEDSDDEETKLLRTIPPGITARTHSISGTQSVILEPEDVKKSRWRSIRIMYLTMFLSSVSFSICMSSLYPYLRILDPRAGTDFLGWVVAAYSVGQLIASPVFGTWSNWAVSYRKPLIASLTVNILANVLFVYLESITFGGKYWLLAARGLIGFGAGNVAVVRAYLSSATTLGERTSAMANLSAFQSVGFILGPLLQTAMVPIGYPGPINSKGFHIDMYTSTGFLGALLGIFNVVLLIFVFKEHSVKDDQFDPFSVQSSGSSNVNSESMDESSDIKPYYPAVITCIGLFFSVLFIFALFETIATPLSMHMFAWTKSKATSLIGVILGGAGVIAIFVFVVIKILSKRINERFILFAGFVFCLAGFVVFLPFGDHYPKIESAGFSKSTNISSTKDISLTFENQRLEHRENLVLLNPNISGSNNHTVESVGCPYEYKWCFNTPAVRLWQLLLGTVFVAIGYPICNVMSYAIYSKLLGPKPQGTWMGMLTAAGSLARVLGPVFVSQIYDAYGPRITFIAVINLILVTLLFLTATFKILVPYTITRSIGVSGNYSTYNSSDGVQRDS